MFDSAGFAHLDVRSAFSLKEGAFVPEHLAARAAAAGMPAVALTDRDGLYGAARFVAAGVTVRSGALNVPLNFALASSKSGVRISIMTGFNIRK